MTTACDELVAVIAKAVRKGCANPTESCARCTVQIRSILAALISAYGEPQIEERQTGPTIFRSDVPVVTATYEHRLVFPWKAVKEATDVCDWVPYQIDCPKCGAEPRKPCQPSCWGDTTGPTVIRLMPGDDSE